MFCLDGMHQQMKQADERILTPIISEKALLFGFFRRFSDLLYRFYNNVWLISHDNK